MIRVNRGRVRVWRTAAAVTLDGRVLHASVAQYDARPSPTGHTWCRRRDSRWAERSAVMSAGPFNWSIARTEVVLAGYGLITVSRSGSAEWGLP
jgi:hypothetical protein